MGYASYKTQGFFIKRSHPHYRILDFIERVDVFQEFPIAVIPVFENLLDDVAPIFISRKRRPVGIPEQVLRKFAKINVRTAHHEKYTKFKGNNPKSQLKEVQKKRPSSWLRFIFITPRHLSAMRNPELHQDKLNL